MSEDTHAILGDNTSFDFVADTYIDDVICALLHAFEQRKSLIEQITKKNCDQHVYSKKG